MQAYALGLVDLVGHALKLFHVAADQRQRRTQAREFMCRTAANARAPAGNGHDLTLEQVGAVDAAVAHAGQGLASSLRC